MKEHHDSHEMKILGKIDSKIAMYCLLGLNLLLVIYIAFFKKDAVWLETLKSGGSENFGKVVQLYQSDSYKATQTSSIEQAFASFKGADTANTDDTPLNTQTLEKEKIDAIMNDGYIMGNKNARITIVEYSDFICPFCKRHYTAQTLEKIVEKYPNDVNMVFRQMPLVQLHPTAPLGAQAAECVGKLGGEKKFYDFLKKGFEAEDFTVDNVTAMATELSINKGNFVKCLSDQSTIDRVNAQIAEGQSFGINGTPGNVIIDKQTGKYVIVAGAYPFEEFDTKVSAMLK